MSWMGFKDLTRPSPSEGSTPHPPPGGVVTIEGEKACRTNSKL